MGAGVESPEALELWAFVAKFMRAVSGVRGNEQQFLRKKNKWYSLLPDTISLQYFDLNAIDVSLRSHLEIHAAVIEHCLATTKNAILSEEDNSSLQSFIKIDPLLGIKKYSIETTEQLRASIYVIEKMLKQLKNVSII